MDPKIANVSEDGDLYYFTLSGVNVSFANALRRTIISDIPVTCIETETHETNKANFLTNTSRLHNEILKHRLSCVPIHNKDLVDFPKKYSLEVNVKNESDNIVFITTEDFRIKNKESGNFLTKEETRKIFPSNSRTNHFIDFARLRPRISETIPGEHIHFTAEFSVATAKQNSMFNVVSKCAYGNTVDAAMVASKWEEQEDKLRSESATDVDIEFQKKNYYLLDAQRQFVDNSFDFVIQTIGIYDNLELVQKGCAVLQNKFIDILQAIESDEVPIFNSETTMDSCYDIILENEDYTIGKVLEYIMYEKYYQGDKTLSFCGFKKFHPHNSDSTLRIAFDPPQDKTTARQYLKVACTDAQELFKIIYTKFTGK